MRWTAYPTDKDKKDKTNGQQREGQVVSDAPPPPPGGKWCIIAGEKKFHLVIVRSGVAAEVDETIAKGTTRR